MAVALAGLFRGCPARVTASAGSVCATGFIPGGPAGVAASAGAVGSAVEGHA